MQGRISQPFGVLLTLESAGLRGAGFVPPCGISKAYMEVMVQNVASQCSSSLPFAVQYQQEQGKAELPSLSGIN